MSDAERDEPQEPVWNHLESGLQMARDDLASCLHPNDYALFGAVAEQLTSLRFGVVIDESSTTTPAFLSEHFPQVSPRLWREAMKKVPEDPDRWNPYVRYHVELHVAERAVSRMHEGLARYAHLRPLVVSRQLPARLQPYLTELFNTYLFGFDPAVIALACAAFEQVAKDVLVALGHLTGPQADRDSLPAEKLRLLLRSHGLISASDGACQKLIRQRNQVMHKAIYEDRLLPQLARDSIASLLEVCDEVSPAWPPAT